nr:DBR1 [Euglena gracilis]
MYVAVEGCCHGELDAIYASLREAERQAGIKVDVLLCCGDFEANRDAHDLSCMNVPPKYLHMGDFPKYYRGEATAPCLTIFIGGNHEAVNHLWELYYGGWVAPNIYFLGFSGCVRVGGLRIAGLSGIHNARDYHLSYFERPPYQRDEKISLYHTRHYETFKLSLIQEPLAIVMSHDWPTGVVHHGDAAQLYRRKPDFQAEVEAEQFGSPASRQLLHQLRPVYWFAAHHHVKFPALVPHAPLPAERVPDSLGAGAGSSQRFWTPDQLPAARPDTSDAPPQQPAVPQPDASAVDLGFTSDGCPDSGLVRVFPVRHPARPEAAATRFLALDKCLPSRRYLQVLHIDDPSPPDLHYDLEWLTILKVAQDFFPASEHRTAIGSLKPLREAYATKAAETRAWLQERAAAYQGGRYADLRVPSNFKAQGDATQTAEGTAWMATDNPQTREFLAFLGIPEEANPIAHPAGGRPLPKRPLTAEIGTVEAQVTALKRRIVALQQSPGPAPALPGPGTAEAEEGAAGDGLQPGQDEAAAVGEAAVAGEAAAEVEGEGGFFLCTCIGACVCKG